MSGSVCCACDTRFFRAQWVDCGFGGSSSVVVGASPQGLLRVR
ncbi:hypothetical protein TPASS_0280 [Treponema pallidum subsp. pallidum SS14]|uniref:Uncharacterized protein TP_0280 n=2 Tax=Treponema pallidum subsp. pallidum TaxID=161 RepID=Y280_TREPA|nr:RecName: Full=Uncharacterized protein TP_0280 [Treponema pallidum subsp. pallidum str. Nichols]AAC65277.1 predicted coding region TP0280 [Treponema pallidum subsp. pallidum str. Nichols]ACD70707.1 hypothetical protein TPASS_0280 [Treponema pallidum subsp. pallidum SS14]